MSYAIADLDAEAEVLLSRAEWDATRRKYTATVGRDDALYPLPVPPGATWARRVTGITQLDAVQFGRSTVRFRLDFGDPAGDAAVPLSALADPPIDFAGRIAALEPRLIWLEPTGGVVTVTAYTAPDLSFTYAPDPRQWIGRWVSPVIGGPPPAASLAQSPVVGLDPSLDWGNVGVGGGYLGTPTTTTTYTAPPTSETAIAAGTVRVAPSPIASYTGAWWADTPWGRALAYAFLPNVAVSGLFASPPTGGPSASDIQAFGGPLDTDVVLVRSPHPYLPAAAIERQRAGPDVVVGDGGGRALRTPVRSRGLSWVRGPGHAASSTPQGWLGRLYRKQEAGGVQGAVNVVTDAIGSALTNVAHSVTGAARNLGKFVTTGDTDALQALAAAALTVAVTGGVGLGIAGTLLQASSVAGSDDPWRAAARVGAIHYAFFVSPLTQAFRAGAFVGEPYGGSATAAESINAVRPGLVEITAKTYGVAGMVVSADDVAAAEVWAQRLQVAAPDEVNAVLQWLAQQGGYIDLVFARLTIEAEQDAAKRRALKAEISVKQAAFWKDYGQYIALAITAVATVLGVGELALAGFAVLKVLYTMGIQAAQLEVALDAQRRAELEADRMVREIEAEIARLEAELAAAGTTALPGLPAPAGTDAPLPAPAGPAPTKYEAWYSPIVRYWRGVTKVQ